MKNIKKGREKEKYAIKNASCFLKLKKKQTKNKTLLDLITSHDSRTFLQVESTCSDTEK